MRWDGRENIFEGSLLRGGFVLIVRWSVNRTSRWMRREFLWLEKDMYVGRYSFVESPTGTIYLPYALSLSHRDGYMIHRSSRGFDHAVA